MTMSLNVWKKYVWFFFFDFSDYQNCIPMNNIKGFFITIVVFKRFFLFWVYAAGFPSCIGRKKKFEKWARTKSNTLWKIRSVKTQKQGTQIKTSLINKNFTTKTFSLPTLMRKIKPVVLLKFEFGCREKFKKKLFSLEFPVDHISDAKEINVFLFECFFTKSVFSR